MVVGWQVRLLSVEERYNLKSEQEGAASVEDDLLFERRSATTLAEKSITGEEGGNMSMFSREEDGEDVSRDGSTVLLTSKDKFQHVTILGAPACGKTTLLQKMRYWAALAAYEDPEELLPVRTAWPGRRCARARTPARKFQRLVSATGVHPPGELRGVRG